MKSVEMTSAIEVLDALKSIGLNLYERKIFIALLSKGVATAAEVSEIANVPRSRSYDILESLAEKGFVVFQPSKPIKYVALSPAEALDRTKHNLTRNHEEMLERIDRMKNSHILEEMDRMHKRGLDMISPADMTGTLKGRFTISRQMQSVFKEAKKSIDILTTEQGLSELHQKHFRVLKKMNKAGVRLRIAAPLRDEAAAKAFSQIAELKNINSPFGRVVSVDNRHMMMALTDDRDVHETQDTAFWAESPHAVSSVVSPLMKQVWGS
jgi:sugar-specific transcriptional regulator TrmB